LFECPGDASLVLMLREWTQAGRLTRDYRVLSLERIRPLLEL